MQVRTLEEEVMHLRQFSMTLMKATPLPPFLGTHAKPVSCRHLPAFGPCSPLSTPIIHRPASRPARRAGWVFKVGSRGGPIGAVRGGRQERGDLALQLQRREQEVADLRFHNEQLQVWPRLGSFGAGLVGHGCAWEAD